MEIERKTVGSVAVLVFSGEFDSVDLPTVQDEMTDVLQEGCDRLVFNFRELTFINSTWIGYLLKTARELKARDGELVLSEPSNFFRRVGEALGVEKVFKILPDDRAALEHFGEDGSAA